MSFLLFFLLFFFPANKESFLLYGKGRPAMIKGISIPAANGSAEDVITPIVGLSSPTALDYDVKEQYIYFVNNLQNGLRYFLKIFFFFFFLSIYYSYNISE